MTERKESDLTMCIMNPDDQVVYTSLDDIVDSDTITEQLQSAMKEIKKKKKDIDEIFDNLYSVALSNFKTVNRDNGALTISFNSDIELMCHGEFYKRHLIDELSNILSFGSEMFYLIYRIYITDDYIMIVRK